MTTVQIALNDKALFALDDAGNVWWRPLNQGLPAASKWTFLEGPDQLPAQPPPPPALPPPAPPGPKRTVDPELVARINASRDAARARSGGEGG